LFVNKVYLFTFLPNFSILYTLQHLKRQRTVKAESQNNQQTLSTVTKHGDGVNI